MMLFILGFLYGVTCQENNIYLSDTPSNISVMNGADILLRCKAQGDVNTIIYRWKHNGKDVRLSHRRQLINGNLLIKHAVGIEDEGKYVCEVEHLITKEKLSSKPALVGFHWLENNASVVLHYPEQISQIFSVHEIKLKCLVEGSGEIKIDWSRNGERIMKSDRIALEDGKLYMKNITRKDNGVYRCTAYNEFGKVHSLKNFALVLPSDNWATIRVIPVDTVVKENTSVKLDCVYENVDVLEWYFEEKGPLSNNTRHAVLSNGSLLVHNANKMDAGMYTCVGIKRESTEVPQKYTAILSLVFPPVIKNHPISKEVAEGTDVMMTCDYVGSPYPITQVFWYKDKTPVPMNSSRIFVDVMNGTLYLTNVEMNDAGNYYCIVKTSFFDLTKSKFATLRVLQKLKFHPLPMGKKMELGMVNKIPCKAEGKDVPSIRWIKGNSVTNAEFFPKHIQDQNGTLYFAKVQQQDKGKYTCIANNSQEEISVTIDVDVVITPKFTILPKSPVESYEGSSVRLDCAAEGDPTPTIQWDNKLIDFSQKRFHVLPNGSLLIDNLHMSDEGYYGCTAGNSGGFNRTEMVLVVRSSDNLRSDGTIDGIEEDTVGKTVVITLSAACAYILLVIILMAWCRYRRKKKKRSYIDSNIDSTHFDEDIGNGKCNPRNPVELKETVIMQNDEQSCSTNEPENTINSESSNQSKQISHVGVETYQRPHLKVEGKGTEIIQDVSYNF